MTMTVVMVVSILHTWRQVRTLPRTLSDADVDIAINLVTSLQASAEDRGGGIGGCEQTSRVRSEISPTLPGPSLRRRL